MQNLLQVQIRRNPKNVKLMTHQVYLQPEGSEETLTFIPTGKSSTNDFPRTNDLKSLLATMSVLLATVLETIVRDL